MIYQKGPSSIMELKSIKKLHRPVLAIPRETEAMLLLFLVKNDAQVKIICRIVLLTIMEMIHLHPLYTH